jgi:hypothetical protein
MKIALICAGGVAALLLLLGWCMTQLRYRIGSRDLKMVLFGLTLRKIPLEEIINVSKRRPKNIAEHWDNCFKANHRLLTIEKSRGIRKYLTITPKNRYIFMADLKTAVRRVRPDSEWANSTGFEEASLAVTEDSHLLNEREQVGENPKAE